MPKSTSSKARAQDQARQAQDQARQAQDQAQFVPVRRKGTQSCPFERVSIDIGVDELEEHVSSRGSVSLRGEFTHPSGWRLYLQLYPPPAAKQ